MLETVPTTINKQIYKVSVPLEMTPARKLQLQLSQFNLQRLAPNFIHHNWAVKTLHDVHILIKEGDFVEQERQHIQQYLVHMPQDAESFMQWFNNLKTEAPGQGDGIVQNQAH